MARFARAVVVGFPYHVTHRGNRREDIFFRDEDRRRYLELLRQYSAAYGLQNCVSFQGVSAFQGQDTK
jgi:putative transposase